MNNRGPNIEPWGTPDKTGAQSDAVPLMTTRCLRSHKKALNQFKRVYQKLHKPPIYKEVFYEAPNQMPSQNL